MITAEMSRKMVFSIATKQQTSVVIDNHNSDIRKTYLLEISYSILNKDRDKSQR